MVVDSFTSHSFAVAVLRRYLAKRRRALARYLDRYGQAAAMASGRFVEIKTLETALSLAETGRVKRG